MIVMRAITGFIFGSGTGSAGPTTGSATSRANMRKRVAALAFLPLIGATPVADLDVQVAGLRDTAGVLRLCLTANPRKFPSCVGDPRAIARTVPAGQRDVNFAGLPAGDWSTTPKCRRAGALAVATARPSVNGSIGSQYEAMLRKMRMAFLHAMLASAQRSPGDP